MNFLKRKNKKGISFLDAWIWTLILWVLGTLLYTTLSSYYITISRVEENNYLNFALSECAEIVHSFRYWEIDNWGSAWWINYQTKYPTGLYKFNYNELAKTWEWSQIYEDSSIWLWYDSFQDMLEKTWYTVDTEWETIELAHNQSTITRYAFINNNTPDKSTLICYAKYNNVLFPKNESIALNDYLNYERLQIIMTDY